MKVMITDRLGMVRHYLEPLLEGETVLEPESPERPDLVVCVTSGEEEASAMADHLEPVERMLADLAGREPSRLVYVSSCDVYPSDAGEDIDEDHPAWATSKSGQARALAEKAVSDWCAARGVTLTVLRPATMFGTGMEGWATEFFSDVTSGRYIHVRGNDARISLVAAYDVADAIRRLNGIGGLYNLSDGHAYTYTDIADAMTANAGAMKRMTHLPAKWADVAWLTCRMIPAVARSLSPATRGRRSRTLTLSNARALAAGCRFFNVGAVLRREEKDYPYEDS